MTGPSPVDRGEPGSKIHVLSAGFSIIFFIDELLLILEKIKHPFTLDGQKYQNGQKREVERWARGPG
jgi:hypothetical protein